MLLVDDEPSNIYYLKSTLERFGLKYLVDTASNGKEAVDKLKESYKYKNMTN